MGTTVAKTPLAEALNQYEDRIGGKFKPDRRFYSRVGINQKRFGLLVRGETPLYVYEIRALSEFFGIPLTNLI